MPWKPTDLAKAHTALAIGAKRLRLLQRIGVDALEPLQVLPPQGLEGRYRHLLRFLGDSMQGLNQCRWASGDNGVEISQGVQGGAVVPCQQVVAGGIGLLEELVTDHWIIPAPAPP